MNYNGQDARCKSCGRTESALTAAGVMFHIPTDTCYDCIKNPSKREVKKNTNIAGVYEGCIHTQPERMRACTDGTCPMCMRIELIRLRKLEKDLFDTVRVIPDFVAVREGNGPEDLIASLTVSLSKHGLLKLKESDHVKDTEASPDED